MKTAFAFSALLVGLSLSCKPPEPPEPAELPPIKSQLCLSAEPKEAIVRVQGMFLKDGCIETFPGELAIEITAPNYKTYKTLFLLEGHANKQHIVLEKEAPVSLPTSTSQPAVSQPTKK
jgi:hypothetical protein